MPTTLGYGGYAGGLHGGHVPLPKAPRPIRQRETPKKRFTVPLLNPEEFSAELVEATAPKPRRRRPAPRRPSGPSPLAIEAEKIDRMVELYKSGLTRKQVAAEVHVAQATVAKYLKERGVPVRPKHITNRRPVKSPVPEVKTCEGPGCGKEFRRRDDERLDAYRLRRTCSQQCKGRLSGQTRRRPAA